MLGFGQEAEGRTKRAHGGRVGRELCVRVGRLFGSCVCLLIDLCLLLKGEHSKLPLSPFLLGCSYLLCCCCVLFSRLVVSDSL